MLNIRKMSKISFKDEHWKLLFTLYVLILFFLNFIRIFDGNFWADEAFSIGLSKMSFGEMINATAMDVHPPLYYIILWIGVKALGQHDWVYHFISIIPFVIEIIFIIKKICSKFGKFAAILMITFVSLMDTALKYNVEVRMYSLAAFFVLLSYYYLYLIITEGTTRSYVFFILSSLGAAYSHYYALVSVAFFYLVLIYLSFKRIANLKKVLLTYIFTVISYLPWTMIAIESFKRTAEDFWIKDVFNIFFGLIYFFLSSSSWPYSIFMTVLAIFLSIELIKYYFKILKTNNLNYQYKYFSKMSSTLICWILCGGLVVIGTLLLGEIVSLIIRPVLYERYLYPACVAFWLAFSVIISKLNKKIFRIFILGLTLCVCIFNYIYVYNTENLENIKCLDTVHMFMKTLKKKT